jgi:hypothetical protein
MLGVVAPNAMDTPHMPQRAGKAAASVAVMPDNLRPACAVAVIGEQALQNVAGGGFRVCGSVEGHGSSLDLSRRGAGKSQYAPHLFNGNTLENLGRDFFGATSGLGVVEDGVNREARSLYHGLPAASSGDALNVRALAPVDHCANVVAR